MENNKASNRIIYIVLVAAIAATSFFAGIIAERVRGAGEMSSYTLRMNRVNKLINQNYYFKDDIDDKRALDNSIAGYVASLGDPFSYYLDESDMQSFEESIGGDYVGIGVEITVDANNYITVITAFSGSAAEKAGIVSGDKITKVYGEPVNGDMLSEVVAKIKGKPGEEVNLEIIKANGEIKELSMTRNTVTKETVSVKTINNIGYVKISSFDTNTDEEFKDKFSQLDLDSLTGIIVDLRSNSGGLLNSVVNVSDLFMPKGDIVKIKYTMGDDKVYESDDENKVTLPIAVLINQGTASAAELLAGGLKDNNNALLIGQNSFGKGVVGQEFQIDSKTALVLTVGEYFLPSGKNIHKTGIEPDFSVELNADIPLSLIEEADDSQLQRAIEELNK